MKFWSLYRSRRLGLSYGKNKTALSGRSAGCRNAVSLKGGLCDTVSDSLAFVRASIGSGSLSGRRKKAELQLGDCIRSRGQQHSF